MLNKPTDKQLLAAARLSGSSDFKEFIGWLEEMLEAQDKSNRTLTEQRLLQGQGNAQTLAHIIEYSDRAKEVLKKIKTTSQY